MAVLVKTLSLALLAVLLAAVVPQDPGVVYQDPGVLSQDPGVLPQHPYMPPVDPGVLNQDRGVLSQDHGVFSQDPGVLSQDPGVIPQDPGVLYQDPCMLSQDRGVVPHNRSVVPQDPCVPPQHPGVVSQDPSVAPQDPGVPPVNPVSPEDLPYVMIVMLVQNKAPYLPYTLTQLSRLDYPKERLFLWIASEDYQDRTAEMLHAWLERHGPLYSGVVAAINSSSWLRTDERSGAHMSAGRRRAVAHMKQAALQSARRRGAEFVWFLDADIILHDRTILRQLLNMRKPIVGPMLSSGGATISYNSFHYTRQLGYHNFQYSTDGSAAAEQDETLLEDIVSRQKRGCFAVSLIRSCVLVDLRDPRTAGINFISPDTEPDQDPVDDAVDDAVLLALSARRAGLTMAVCNQEDFGLVPPPLTETQPLRDEWRNMVNLKLKAMVDHPPLPVESFMRPFLPPPSSKSRLGFDKIYVITLRRRPERWRRLNACLDELGSEVTRVNAVDGRQLNDSFLEERNIHPRGRGRKKRLNMGEIGCALSHYAVWKDVQRRGLKRAIVLEDDVHPTAEFPERVRQLVAEADSRRPEWDFLYLHRLHHDTRDDEPVEGTTNLVRPGFCYSAAAYALTSRGARILLRDRPLENLLCVDHYIPLMAGNNPRSSWMKRFPGAGSLNTFAGAKNLLEPVARCGEPGYTSDTSEVGGVIGARSCPVTSAVTRDARCVMADL